MSAADREVPDFTCATTDESTGGLFRLSSSRGGPLVLYFYPKDSTPGCTDESAQFRDLHGDFAAAGATILGCSRDSLKSHANFRAKLGLPFHLLSDKDEAVCTLFGVMKDKVMYGKPVRGIERSTFVLDTTGRIAAEWRGVKVPGHAAQVLDFVRSLSPTA